MSELTRRRFVGKSASAAVGVTVVGAIAASRADARESGTEPIVAYVKNPSTGEIAVLSGDREVTVHDRGLAAQIARASR